MFKINSRDTEYCMVNFIHFRTVRYTPNVSFALDRFNCIAIIQDYSEVTI